MIPAKSELILETQCLWFEPYRLQHMLDSIGAFVSDHGALTGLGDNDHPQYLLAASYTAADVLAKLLTVDGAGSGLDADLLDGNSSAYFLAASSYTAADVLAKLLTVDGAGSGLDADLLDGLSSAAFATSGHNHDSTYVNVSGDTMTGSLVISVGTISTESGYAWDLGTYTGSVVTATGYVTVTIAGTDYRLLTAEVPYEYFSGTMAGMMPDGLIYEDDFGGTLSGVPTDDYYAPERG